MHLSRVSRLVRTDTAQPLKDELAKMDEELSLIAQEHKDCSETDHIHYAVAATLYHLPVLAHNVFPITSLMTHLLSTIFFKQQPTCNDISWLFMAHSWPTNSSVRSLSL